MYQIWRIYLDLWGHDWKKWVWPTFGCKLDQSEPIVMQLELDMSCHLLNVYTKFQIDILKHVEEKSGKRGRTNEQTDGRTLGCSPGWHRAIICTNARILLNGTLDSKFSEILVKIHILSFKKMHLKMLSANLYPFWLGLNVLTLLQIHVWCLTGIKQ